MKFTCGDRVRMWTPDDEGGRWVGGEVTLIREHDRTCKVMFDDVWNYDYYPEADLVREEAAHRGLIDRFRP
jgi:hypothetical protein